MKILIYAKKTGIAMKQVGILRDQKYLTLMRKI